MKLKRLIPILLLIALLISCALPVSAAEAGADTERTYTVRVYAGAQGTIDGGAVREYTCSYNQLLTFDPLSEVAVSNESKYYVKGFRESGKDNQELAIPTFRVTEDKDYVIAYGLKGTSVAYTVSYVEEGTGRELYPTATFYGNVGDKPVVSFQYIEGYQPQAYNSTKTLSENEAENVFVFTYTGVAAGEEEPLVPGVVGPEDEETGAGGEEENPEGENPEDLPEQDTPTTNPEGPEDLEDLDDQDVPLAGPIEEIIKLFSDAAAMPLGLKIAVCAGGALIISLFGLLLFRKKKDKEESQNG